MSLEVQTAHEFEVGFFTFIMLFFVRSYIGGILCHYLLGGREPGSAIRSHF